MPEIQTVDPEVSRAKFAREIERHRALEATYRARGCFLLDADFPQAFVLFATTKLKPPVIPGAVVVDFTNYDLRPPSVTFVDPFTREPVKTKDLRMAMPRRPTVPGATPETIFGMMQQGMPVPNMIQTHGSEEPPFLCLPGVREYHDNPAHTGDSWLLHRGSGEGSLAFILETIWKYGTNPFDQFQLQIQTPMITVVAPAQAIPE